MSDTVSLHSLTLSPNIGPDCWNRTRSQPVVLTVHVHTSLIVAATTDDVADTIHYGHLSTAIFDLQSPTRSFASLFHFGEAVAAAAIGPQFPAVEEVHVIAEAPKLILQAGALSIELVRRRSATPPLPDKVYIKDLALPVLIGVNPPERLHKQLVITTVSFHSPVRTVIFPHSDIVDCLSKHIESTSYLTLEAFVTSVARVACSLEGMDTVTVGARKPSAVSFGHSSGVQVTRDRAFFQRVH
ncbi:tetrahydrobiopterin biosynthesis enzymes-like protein [Ramaria rubella]|nr:tetrahydrobiopterin biosynthesis enzymes-like protein [Ramaria rubella]